MTITVSSLVAGPFAATGASQALPFTFKIFSADEIEVYYGDDSTVVAPADYTVDRNTSAAGDALEGGTVTLDAAAVPAAASVYVRAVPEFIQEQVYSSAGTRLENLNEALDRGALRDIHMRDRIEAVEEGFGSVDTAVAAAAAAAADRALAQTAREEADAIRTAFLQNTVLVDLWPGVVGDGVTDDAAALQECFDENVGARVLFGPRTYAIGVQLSMRDGSLYDGQSVATLRALDGAAIAGSVLHGDATVNARVLGLEIDGNKASSGAAYGVSFLGGSGGRILDCTIRNTTAAGGRFLDGSDHWSRRSRYLDCGIAVGTDNHGLMIAVNSGSQSDCGSVDDYVENAYRKGIATYTGVAGAPSQTFIVIQNARATGCGLTGVYVAAAPGATPTLGTMVSNAVCWSNYVNFDFADASHVVATGLISRASEAAGISMTRMNDGLFSGVSISDSGTAGLVLDDCDRNMFDVAIMRPNRVVPTGGFGPGLQVSDSSDNVFRGKSIDDAGVALMTHGVIEQGTSNGNDFDMNVAGATSALWTITGANTRYRTRSGRNTGFNTSAPLNTLHINGGLTLSEQGWALADGSNNDVALPSNAGNLYTGGPTANYTITGIAGGHAGRRLTIFNYTNFTMTLAHNSGSSSAGNKLLIGGAADKVLAAFGSCELVYSGGASAWLIVGSQG